MRSSWAIAYSGLLQSLAFHRLGVYIYIYIYMPQTSSSNPNKTQNPNWKRVQALGFRVWGLGFRVQGFFLSMMALSPACEVQGPPSAGTHCKEGKHEASRKKTTKWFRV